MIFRGLLGAAALYEKLLLLPDLDDFYCKLFRRFVPLPSRFASIAS